MAMMYVVSGYLLLRLAAGDSEFSFFFEFVTRIISMLKTEVTSPGLGMSPVISLSHKGRNYVLGRKCSHYLYYVAESHSGKENSQVNL
jgi:hypothetical protein